MRLRYSRNYIYHMIKSIIESIGLYGAEIWEITETNKKKLQAFQMDFKLRNVQIRPCPE
jgi:hypothetical protein